MAYCPRCGAVLAEGSTLCTKCRTPYTTVVHDHPLQPGPTMTAPGPPVGSPPPGSPAPKVQGTEGSPPLPPQVREFVAELENWATLNRGDARRDTIRFWVLKIPAVASSASASILALAHLDTIAAVVAAIASACILIDAVNPGGQLRNAHLRAVHELRTLQHELMNEWRIASLRGSSSDSAAAQLLENAEKVRARIAADLGAAETAFARGIDATAR